MSKTIAEPFSAPPQKRHRLAADLRALTQTLSPGQRLPSVAEIESRFGVSTTTVEAAVEALRREGLVVRRRGAGTFVAPRALMGKGDGKDAATTPAAKRTTLAIFALCSNPFFENCVSHLIREAERVGLSVECRYANKNLTLEDALRFEALTPAGFVVVGMGLEWLAVALRERDHAVVLIGDPKADAVPVAPTIYADAEYAGYVATRRLLDLGHRCIVYALPSAVEADLRSRRRWRGHERALREAGVEGPYPVINLKTVESWIDTPQAACDYFAEPGAPTAVAAWYDADAVLVMSALNRAGLQVPRDVSVIGYDNLPLGEHTWPPLDTVDLHMDEQVRHALRLLLPSTPQRASASATLITPTLISRASCAAPPRSKLPRATEGEP